MSLTGHTLAILCGGRSSRLGTDKGLYTPLGDESLVVRAIRNLGDIFPEILIVVADEEQQEIYQSHLSTMLPDCDKVRVIADSSSTNYLCNSTIQGVISAMSGARHPKVCILPVDQVAVKKRHLKQLIISDQNGSAYQLCNELFPFPSIWHQSDFSRVKEQVAAGSRGVRVILSSLGPKKIDGDVYGEELKVNCNTKYEMESFFGKGPLYDRFGRRMHYLRLSLTEACNMSCTYCLPEGFPEWYRHKAKLSVGDISVLLKGFRQMGFRKVRFTGGEPTVHRGALDSLRIARDLGFEHLAMTTNGVLIKNLKDWVDAGLDQLNISLDSLNPVTFAKQTKSKDHSHVMGLIEEAIDLGVDLKINTVLLRSVNGGEKTELINWALARPLTLRFIELMPTKLNNDFYKKEQVLGTEIEPELLALGLSQLSESSKIKGPATEYSSPDFPGKIGLINPLSCNFCNRCNRLRVSAKGTLRLCLFGDQDLSLDLGSPDTVERDVRRLISKKGEQHQLLEGDTGNVFTFRNIGG